MAGCFGNSPIDRHFQNQLESYLGSDDHHHCCPCHEDFEDVREHDDDGQWIEPECTCDEWNESDRCESQLDRMEEEY